MKDTIVMILIIILSIAIVVGLAVGLVYLIAPPECDAKTANIGYPHRWSFWGGCQISIQDNQWIPLDNYIFNEPKH